MTFVHYFAIALSIFPILALFVTDDEMEESGMFAVGFVASTMVAWLEIPLLAFAFQLEVAVAINLLIAVPILLPFVKRLGRELVVESLKLIVFGPFWLATDTYQIIRKVLVRSV